MYAINKQNRLRKSFIFNYFGEMMFNAVTTVIGDCFIRVHILMHVSSYTIVS